MSNQPIPAEPITGLILLNNYPDLSQRAAKRRKKERKWWQAFSGYQSDKGEEDDNEEGELSEGVKTVAAISNSIPREFVIIKI